jgi:hypothetical protein
MPAGEHQMQWALGNVLRISDGTNELRQYRPVSDQEAEHLQTSARLVRDIASIRDFQSLVQAVERWLASVEQVRTRLVAGETLPEALLVSATLDLAAMKLAGANCVRHVLATADSLRTEGHADATHSAAIETALRFLQTRQAYLICESLADEPPGAPIALTLLGSAVRLGAVTAFNADAFGYVLLAEIAQFTVVTLAALADAISESIRQFEALLEEAPEGVMPDLVRVEGTDGPSRATFTALPIAQAVALRSFSARIATLTPDQFAEAVSEVIRADVQQQIAIGSVDVTTASENARTTTAVNEMPHAQVTLAADLLGSAPVDYWSAVTFDAISEGTGERLFAGAVQRAFGGEELALDCEGAVELAEQNRGSLVAAGIEAAELITTIMRQIGLPDETISLARPEQPAQIWERFEVFVPVRGLVVSHRVRIGRTEIVPVAEGLEPLQALNLTPAHVQPLADEYRNGTAYALASVNADALDTAEEQGFAAVETTMAWLVARQRYGFLRLPDGTPQAFSRERAMHSARYGSVVLVRGETTRRQWLRWVQDAGHPTAMELTAESDVMHPVLPEDLDLADVRALRALMRAVNEPGLQQQVQALSEALEAYAAGVQVPQLFSRAEREKLRDLAPAWMSLEQKGKFETAVDSMNTPPFGVRLSERLGRDGVPLTLEERELLFGKLRSARNDVAHGRAVEVPPTRDEVLRGISLVGRALLFSIAARA